MKYILLLLLFILALPVDLVKLIFTWAMEEEQFILMKKVLDKIK